MKQRNNPPLDLGTNPTNPTNAHGGRPRRHAGGSFRTRPRASSPAASASASELFASSAAPPRAPAALPVPAVVATIATALGAAAAVATSPWASAAAAPGASRKESACSIVARWRSVSSRRGVLEVTASLFEQGSRWFRVLWRGIVHPPSRDSSMVGCLFLWRWRALANSVRCGRVYEPFHSFVTHHLAFATLLSPNSVTKGAGETACPVTSRVIPAIEKNP